MKPHQWSILKQMIKENDIDLQKRGEKFDLVDRYYPKANQSPLKLITRPDISKLLNTSKSQQHATAMMPRDPHRQAQPGTNNARQPQQRAAGIMSRDPPRRVQPAINNARQPQQQPLALRMNAPPLHIQHANNALRGAVILEINKLLHNPGAYVISRESQNRLGALLRGIQDPSNKTLFAFDKMDLHMYPGNILIESGFRNCTETKFHIFIYKEKKYVFITKLNRSGNEPEVIIEDDAAYFLQRINDFLYHNRIQAPASHLSPGERILV